MKIKEQEIVKENLKRKKFAELTELRNRLVRIETIDPDQIDLIDSEITRRLEGGKRKKKEMGKKKIELKINYVMIQLWNGQEHRVYIGDIDASIEGIVEQFLEVNSVFTEDDVKEVIVRF